MIKNIDVGAPFVGIPIRNDTTVPFSKYNKTKKGDKYCITKIKENP